MAHSAASRNLTSKEFLSTDDYAYMEEIAADAEVDEFLRSIATNVLNDQPEKAVEALKLLGEDSCALLRNPELQWALATALEYGVARGDGASAALLGDCYRLGFLVDQNVSQAKKLRWKARLLDKSWAPAKPMKELPCFKHMDEQDGEDAIQRRSRYWESSCMHHAPVRSFKETLCAMNALKLKVLWKQHARHLAEVYLELCGLIGVDELTEIYLRYYPNEYTREEFRDFLLHGGLDDYSYFDVWNYKDKPHIMSFELVEEELVDGIGSYAIINGDKMTSPTDEEDFRRYLYARHAEVGAPWEVPSKTAAELEAYEYQEQIEALPSCVALKGFLDANVPDDSLDNYYFADGIIEDLIDMAQFEYRPQEVIEAMQGYGLVFDSIGKLNQLLTLVMNFMNDMPHWSNNGWSPSELLRRELEKGAAKGGRKVFYDEHGKPRSIGRNEPCPCGSGKKYKKCCGR